jgi:DNA polymerase III subunit delta
MTVDLDRPVFLVKGKDEVLLAQAVADLVGSLVGDGDRTLMVDELSAARYGDVDTPDIAPVVDAAQTPPFLTDRRIVVARQAGLFGTKDAVVPLVAYLADPLPSTTLVVVWEREAKPGVKLPAVPKSLTDAIKSAGGVVIDAAVADSGKQRSAWIDQQLRDAAVQFDTNAKRLVDETVGGDLGRLRSVLEVLESTFGPGAKLTPDDVAPYLGEAGAMAPWDLTDAIDLGDIPLALDRLERMLGAGRHPLQIMAVLHGHFERMLRLDGAAVRGEREAAEMLGTKSTFPAKKALEQGRRLGSERLHECVELLSGADLDLRGAKNWPDDLVMEVLVARLAGRSRQAAGSRARAR